MSEKLETKKFVFTAEGETEQWYLESGRSTSEIFGQMPGADVQQK